MVLSCVFSIIKIQGRHTMGSALEMLVRLAKEGDKKALEDMVGMPF